MSNQKYTANRLRCIKEAGIQVYEMEKYKWLRNKKFINDLGNVAIYEWAKIYGKKVRK